MIIDQYLLTPYLPLSRRGKTGQPNSLLPRARVFSTANLEFSRRHNQQVQHNYIPNPDTFTQVARVVSSCCAPLSSLPLFRPGGRTKRACWRLYAPVSFYLLRESRSDSLASLFLSSLTLTFHFGSLVPIYPWSFPCRATFRGCFDDGR